MTGGATRGTSRTKADRGVAMPRRAVLFACLPPAAANRAQAPLR
jgi:hypothetical protein